MRKSQGKIVLSISAHVRRLTSILLVIAHNFYIIVW